MLKNKIFLKYFAIALTGLLFIVGVFSFLSVRTFYLIEKNKIKNTQESELLIQKERIEKLLDDALVDLYVITESDYFLEFYENRYKKNIVDQTGDDLFIKLLKYKTEYNQFRFLNCAGQEIFRINRLDEEQVPKIVDYQNLQNKSERYYYREAAKLKSGQVYISPMDLNVEQGEIEHPFRPMIRLCKPIFDNKGKMAGIGITNFEGNAMLNLIHNIGKKQIGKVYLLNEDGYFLHHPDSAKEWGFMFPEREKFNMANEFPEEKDTLNQITEGQLEIRGSLFTIYTIDPLRTLKKINPVLQNSSVNKWKLITYIPKKEITIHSLAPIRQFYYWSIVLVLLIVSFSFYYATNKYKKEEWQQELIKSEHELRLANESKNLFFSILSHDMKNSLGSQSMYLDYIIENLAESDKNQLSHSLNEILDVTKNQIKLLEDILFWARVQMGVVEYKPKLIPLCELLDEQKNLWKLSLLNKQLELIIDIPDQLKIYADKAMINTALRNLINNAIKFSYPGKTITINATKTIDETVIDIIDQGTGMSPEVTAALFDVSKKITKDGTSNETGSGFGLKMVDKLIQKNNGYIKVKSTPGKGSTFTIVLRKTEL